MKFSELEKLCDDIRDKLKCYVSISVSRDSYSHTESETKYNFYTERASRTLNFKTSQDLRAHMESLLNPPADEGITIDELEEMAEDGILRGAE